jgi:hypothetical protein
MLGEEDESRAMVGESRRDKWSREDFGNEKEVSQLLYTRLGLCDCNDGKICKERKESRQRGYYSWEKKQHCKVRHRTEPKGQVQNLHFEPEYP